MFKKLLLLVLITVFIQSCSVGMALHGEPEPDLGAVALGKKRGEIETHLGSPVTSTTLDDGNRLDIYEYQIGNEGSPGRAIGHAAMDVLTFGIWELIGTPIEGFSGEKYRATITYNDSDEVIDLNSKRVKKNF